MKDIDYVYEGSKRSSKSEIDLLIQELRDTIDNQRETIQELEKIRKEAIKIIKKQMPICIMPNNTLIHGTEKAKALENLLNILNKGNNKEK